MNNQRAFREPRAEKKSDRTGRESLAIFLRLAGYIKKHGILFLIAVAMTLLSNQLALLGPKYSGEAIDAISAKDGVNFDLVWESVIKMLLCYVVSAVLSYLLSVIMVKLSQKIVYTMRKQLFEKLNTLPVGYFDTHPVGDIVSRISYDIDTVNGSLSHDLVQVMTSVYTVLGSFLFMWRISKPMLVVVLVSVPISIVFTRYRTRKVRPMFRARSAKLGELNGYAEEMLSGCRAISAYGREKTFSHRFSDKNTEATAACHKAEFYGGTMGPSVMFINNLSVALVTVLGGILYMFSQNGTVKAGALFFITLGGVAQFVQYCRKFAGPINEFANILHEFQSAFSAAERVFRVLDESPETPDTDTPDTLGEVKGEVSLRDVSFGYVPEKQVLKNVDIHAKQGDTVAIVGPTGAGKTTVINLLMRFYDPDTGGIYIDGKDILTLRRRELRSAFTMVLQDTWLFYGTVRDNIKYGKENATDEEMIAAAKAAHIHSYVMSLPDGYDTLLSDDGVNISGGQRQLITIARAMLSDAPMLILDEATSHVDSRTEKKIQDAMDTLMKGRTSFVIAHRLSTVENADLILVVQDGKITEQGTHAELMEIGGFYSSLYGAQFE